MGSILQLSTITWGGSAFEPLKKGGDYSSKVFSQFSEKQNYYCPQTSLTTTRPTMPDDMILMVFPSGGMETTSQDVLIPVF